MAEAEYRCTHDMKAWSEVTIEWCPRCSSWRLALEVAFRDSCSATGFTRLYMKGRFVPDEEMGPDEALFFINTAMCHAQEAYQLVN